MSVDIFGRLPLVWGGAVSSDSIVAQFALGPGVEGGVGLLAQSLEIQYGYRLDRLYEIGSRFVFYVAGRSEGGITLYRVLGPRPVVLAFYKIYGNPCFAPSNVLVFAITTGCAQPGDNANILRFALFGIVFSDIRFMIRDASSMLMNEILVGRFVVLATDM